MNDDTLTQETTTTTHPQSIQEKKRQQEVEEAIQFAPLEESIKASPQIIATIPSVSEQSPVLLTIPSVSEQSPVLLTIPSVSEQSPILLTPQGKHHIVTAQVHHHPTLDRGKEVQTRVVTGEGDEISQVVGTIPHQGPQQPDTLQGITPIQPPIPDSGLLGQTIRGTTTTTTTTTKESSPVVASIAETEEQICKHMFANRKCSFEDLLPDNAIRLEAGHIFAVLLVLHSKRQVKMEQLTSCGNITVTFLQD
ncbi:hypothetical protein Pmani_004023 [Petrolisthes manimaculis]|uniref:Uncharacterized protein n=1 Tax=Petrolisthes manimaculis TaxID=1843537 RepID=A0AAE1UHX2_9EUCA|nr:hypothetical protein Pmani_004023 [Petrolisthes manimaculis]